MTEPKVIETYHAHVYYDAATKPAAARIREAVEARFEVVMGRWHDKPVGPHPMWSYQIAFAAVLFGEIIPFLALNREGLTVFIHPNTGDAVADHTAHVMWLGASQDLDISALS
jgi:aromatic ring-cleaving dioxygenase